MADHSLQKIQTQIRNIGIFAHVDAGKTTLTERMLQHCGAIREAGSVDSGTAHTDRMDIERRRGISIRATCAPMTWRGIAINLLDTPGHVDFSAEVERSLWALDGAILLLSAVDGVQPQTSALFAALTRSKLPVLVFVNKMDREGADLAAAIADARGMLSDRVVDATDDEQIMTLLAEDDEAALSAYLDGIIFPHTQLIQWLREKARKGQAYPAWSGSALRDEGVDALLDAVVDCLPAPVGDMNAEPSGIVFGIDQDKTLGRAAHVRMYTGTLQNRDSIQMPQPAFPLQPQETKEAKITQIRTLPLEGKGTDIGQLLAGAIGAVYGLGDVRVGQVLGDPKMLPRDAAMGGLGTPLLMVKVEPEGGVDPVALRNALMLLSAEEPMLGVETYAGALHLRVMGAVQLEVLTETIETRFGIKVHFGKPNVIYRETIRQSAVGFYAYTMPKPCWAVIKFQVDPLPCGSGIRYDSVVPAREIMPRYQHQIEQALPLALRQGMLGWQVDDVRITLIGGEHHLIHTHPMDFILATPVALMDGLRRGGTRLLEPILQMDILSPEAYCGRLIGEIVSMRGEMVQSQQTGTMRRLTARVPMATSVDFSIRLAALTSGEGSMSMRICGYQPCDPQPPPQCPRHGVHPLDTAKYILAARNALQGGIFES